MPPAISDDEMSESGAVEVPVATDDDDDALAPAPIKGDLEEPQVDGDDDNDDDDEENGDEDDDMEEDVFVVEKIVGHVFNKGTIKYLVKWEGYEKKEDQTWEDEENLRTDASAVLDAYLKSVGGRAKIVGESRTAGAQKKRGRPASTANTPNGAKRSKGDSHSASGTPPAGVPKKWTPPAGSWEEHVSSIDACHDAETGKLMVYLTWNNGHKTQHDTKIVYARCPQKMLLFYERHVKIIKTSDD